MAEFVSYLRVSTTQQGISGLGLEAQRVAVQNYVSMSGGVLLDEFVEIESGGKRNRPVLVQSIAQAGSAKATLLIAKLDRLARNVAFISSLMESGVDFVAVDAPYANRLMLHILAAFAEHERDQISARTRAALAAAKARGVELGTNGKVLAAANRMRALEFAESMRPHIAAATDRGHLNLRELCERLNQAGSRTRQGALWSPGTVQRVIRRLALGTV